MKKYDKVILIGLKHLFFDSSVIRGWRSSGQARTIMFCVIPVIILAIFCFVFPVKSLAEDKLTVSNISTKTEPGYALSWPSGKGTVDISRSSDGGATFANIGTTDFNFYMDVTAAASITYVYKVSNTVFSLTGASSLDVIGKPVISAINIGPGITGKEEASVIVSFKTEILSKAQVFYGESASYGSQTGQESNLNQSHTIVIEKLKPSTTYHLKITAVNKDSSDTAQSDDQIFATASPPQDQSIFQIIIDALTRAFAGFAKWFNS